MAGALSSATSNSNRLNPAFRAQSTMALMSCSPVRLPRAVGETHIDMRQASDFDAAAAQRTMPTSDPETVATKVGRSSACWRQASSGISLASSIVVPNASGASSSAARRMRLSRRHSVLDKRSTSIQGVYPEMSVAGRGCVRTSGFRGRWWLGSCLRSVLVSGSGDCVRFSQGERSR